MDMMEDLKKENEYLREQYYGNRVVRRQAIIQDLIRRGVDADTAIEEAKKVCAFIEGIAPVTAEKRTSKGYTPKGMLRAIGVRGKAAKDILAGKNPKTGKRKYTKRSKFWAKKK